MRKIKLLYETEHINKMMSYYYDVHTWRYDVKFWLVGDKWCTNLDGQNIVGELEADQIEVIQNSLPIIEQHEKENKNWIAFQNCKKRTCICKSCVKFCNCGSCKGKINHCDEKQLNV